MDEGGPVRATPARRTSVRASIPYVDYHRITASATRTGTDVPRGPQSESLDHSCPRCTVAATVVGIFRIRPANQPARKHPQTRIEAGY